MTAVSNATLLTHINGLLTAGVLRFSSALHGLVMLQAPVVISLQSDFPESSGSSYANNEAQSISYALP